MRALPIAIVVALLLGLPGSAGAVGYLNPPGSSGINQYTEVVPTATGSTPTGGIGAGVAPAGSGGSAFSRFVTGTSPVRRGAAPTALPPSGGASVIGSVADAASGSGGGLGIALPLILGGAAAVALGLLLVRRRRS